ncbi:MAG: hypothetical protein LQ341_005827, partial [Variospora aurantia]
DNKMFYMALIDELVSRRKWLLTNSRVLLPRYIFERLTSSLRGLPDIEAFFLIRALLEAGDNIDPHHWCYTSSSVYDFEEITPEIAELFFGAGFTDLEGKDSYGLTVPLRTAMQACRSEHRTVMLAKLYWLLLKSVSLRRHVEKKGLSEWLIPSVNVISAMLGPLIAFQKPRISKATRDTLEKTLRQVLGMQMPLLIAWLYTTGRLSKSDDKILVAFAIRRVDWEKEVERESFISTADNGPR